MKIAAAQIDSRLGHASQNALGHLKLVDLAAKHNANMVVFPEMSLTGYEPSVAAQFAVAPDDSVFETLQAASNKHSITIVVGAPLLCDGLPQISAFIIEPRCFIRVYSKHYLHSDEKPYFSPGQSLHSLVTQDPSVALAICYELSVKQHAEAAFASGACVYVASVSKTETGVCAAGRRLSWVAQNYSAISVMANGVSGDGDASCSGRSAAWGRSGNLIASLDSTSEAVLVVDSMTEEWLIATL